MFLHFVKDESLVVMLILEYARLGVSIANCHLDKNKNRAQVSRARARKPNPQTYRIALLEFAFFGSNEVNVYFDMFSDKLLSQELIIE